MPGPTDVKKFILIPRLGRGMITSRDPQVLAEYTDSFKLLQNVIIKDGAWIWRALDGAITIPGSGPVWALHGFNAIDTTSPGTYPTTTFLVHRGETTGGSGSSILYRTDTSAAVTVNGVNFATTNPSDCFFLNVKNRCLVAGRTLTGGAVPTIVERYPTQTSYQWGKNGPVVDLTYDSLQPNVTNTNTKTFFQAADATFTNGSAAVTSAGSHFDNSGAWTGKTIYARGSEKYTISTVTATNALTLTANYTGTTGGGLDYKVTYGELSWQGPGPQYAYAYYNPNTGHISNVGTVMSVSEQNVSTVRMNITSIQGTNDANYTKIVLFRTALAGGSVLLPLKLDPSHGGTASIDSSLFMINNNYTGTRTYSDGQADSQLGQILGTPSDINGTVAPFLNNPPPADIKFMAAWDGRIWVVSAATPYRLQYSGNSAQIPLGRAEESFPFSNYLDLQGDDGFFTALKVVGTTLLAYTEKFIYFIDNSGPYRLLRVSSRGAGVDPWATDEHPGDSSEQSASVVFVGRDRRLWRQYPAGKIEDIGWPIQDKLDAVSLNTTRPLICRVAQVGKVWMLALGIRNTNGYYDWMFYDFDEQAWYDFGLALGLNPNNVGLSGMWNGAWPGVYYTGSQQGSGALAIGTQSGTTAEVFLMAGSTATVGLPAEMWTQHLDFGDRLGKKGLQEVTLYVSNDTPSIGGSSWAVYANFDESGVWQQLKQIPTTGTPRDPGGAISRWNLPTSVNVNQFHSVQIRVVLAGQQGTEFVKVYKIVIAYNIDSTGEAGANN